MNREGTVSALGFFARDKLLKNMKKAKKNLNVERFTWEKVE